MKSLPEVRFESRLCDSDSRKVYNLLITRLNEQCSTPSTDILADLCREYVRSPTEALLRKIVSEHQYSDQLECYTIFQLQALFKKNASFDIGVDTRAKALETFYQAESICRGTNRKLRTRDDPDYRERATLIFEMSRKISQALGSLPNLDEINFGFGPGTNVGCSKNTSIRMKLSADATGTADAVRLFSRLIPKNQTTTELFYHWPGLERLKVVRGSSWTAVPKTSLTDRGINVEPIINSYLQKGFGSVIRERLRNVGVNLNDQSLNQRLARIGSKDGSLATIDLSMASDTVSYLLVMDLLPPEWFEVLDACRSSVCTVSPGKYVIQEKFSAMGNGYTFELESLIFWALLRTICGNDAVISVYGDDLICPAGDFDNVIHALKLIGFIPNPEKSFGVGPFRESCGKDYLDGTDVRPLYCKSQLSVKEIFRIHNFFARTGRLDIGSDLISFIPRRFRIFGPDGYGDGHLVGSYKVSYDKRGWEPFIQFKTYKAKTRHVYKPTNGDWGAFIYLTRNSSDRQVGDSLWAERNANPSYKLSNVRVPAGR